MASRKQLVYEELIQLMALVTEMRETGILVSREQMDAHFARFAALLVAMQQEFRTLVPDEKFQLGTTGQHKSLHRLFFGHFGLAPLKYTKEGQPALDTPTLKLYAAGTDASAQVAALVVKIRSAGKLQTTYCTPKYVCPDGKIHPAWSPWKVTGRWGSSPNMQNIPGAYKDPSSGKLLTLRDIFIVAPGNVLVAADFSALELRIAAILANDSGFLEAFAAQDAKTGMDVHTKTSYNIFPAEAIAKEPKVTRNLTKTANYSIIYGISIAAFHAKLSLSFPAITLREAANIHRNWFKANPAFIKWHQKQLSLADRNGYVQAPVSGARRYTFWDGESEANVVYNFPVQSIAAKLANLGVLALWAELKRSGKGKIILQVHDEIVVEGKAEDKQYLANALTQSLAAPLELCGRQWSFPVECKAGADWGHMEKC